MGESSKKSLKRRIFDIIQIGNKDDLISRSFDWFIVIIIILNILTVFLDTFEELSRFKPLFRVVEAVTVSFFCIEYTAYLDGRLSLSSKKGYRSSVEIPAFL